jgi:tetratricopeptide (TPR) repeat protein
MSRIELLKGFVATNPNDPFPRYALALEYKNGGQLDDAAATFQELMERLPDYTPTYLHAGNTERERGRLAEAQQIYERGIQTCQRKADHHALGELRGALESLLDEAS